MRPGVNRSDDWSRVVASNGEGRFKSYLLRARLLPGEEGLKQRMQLLARLRELGTEVVDLTAVPPTGG